MIWLVVGSIPPSFLLNRTLTSSSERRKNNWELMLQLADATFFGICGFGRDKKKAMKFYRFEAIGCSTSQFDSFDASDLDPRFGHLRGIPEAMAAFASIVEEKLSVPSCRQLYLLRVHSWADHYSATGAA